MVEFCDFKNLEIVFQLILAMVVGSLIGLEREYQRKEAGLRTFSLVCLGSALFTVITFKIFANFPKTLGISFDPSRIIGQIVIGIGFLGAGIIIFRQRQIAGLTTAAALWVTAAIGAAIGARFYFLAIFVTFLAILILAGLRILEEKFLGTKKT